VAAYRIVTEALTNVARHATARHCHVGIAMDERSLLVAVEDDGVGLPAQLRYGVGLNAMRERATELGGTCTAETAPGGGTRIEARIPVA
jgi:signal transduction histidine kinase